MTAVILASGSPSRLSILRAAGVEPTVIVSGVDEDAALARAEEERGRELTTAEQTAVLATAKGRAVISELTADSLPGRTGEPVVLIASDSMLELDGRAVGKPHTPERARALWRDMGGRTAYLHSGIFMARLSRVSDGGAPAVEDSAEAVGSTLITTAELTDAEIDAYVGTEEPLEVAGGLTIDGYGAAFVTRIEGDHTNVLGMSVPLLRNMCRQLGIEWHSLWNRASGASV